MSVDVRYVFFVSSTFSDLREERQQVIQAILEHGHLPVGMEVFPSADEEPWKIIADTIKESDYYVVLSAGRYGNCFPDGTSFTEREFDLAQEMGTPTIGFIHKSPLDLPAANRDDSPKLRARLADFHLKVRQRYVRTWGTLEELGLQTSKAVVHATRMNPRIGWVRADKARSTVDLEKLEQLRQTIENLESENAELENKLEEVRTFLRASVLPEDDLQPDLLAQGADDCGIVVRYSLGSEKYEGPVELSWDECFSLIAPSLYQVVNWRDYQGRFTFEADLKAFLRRRVGLEGSRTVSIDKPEIDKILFQFKQLGYIHITETADGRNRGWALTPLGEVAATRILTKLRD